MLNQQLSESPLSPLTPQSQREGEEGQENVKETGTHTHTVHFEVKTAETKTLYVWRSVSLGPEREGRVLPLLTNPSFFPSVLLSSFSSFFIPLKLEQRSEASTACHGTGA